MIGDKVTLTLEAECIAGEYSDVEMHLHFTIGCADFFECEADKGSIENSIGSICGVYGGRGGVELHDNESGDVWYIDAPTLWQAFQAALEEGRQADG